MARVTTTITNGVNVDDLVKTVNAVKDNPDIAKFNFNISNRWLGGSHNRSVVSGFSGALQSLKHEKEFVMDAGEHQVLLGNDEGANPVEYLLHALAACVTTSLVYHAASQGIEIEAVESTVDGDLDLRGFLGLDPSIRNGFQKIRVALKIKSNANEQDWDRISKLGPTFSPVFDSLVRGVPVEINAARM